MVSPKPEFTPLTTSFSGMPAAIPNPKAATSSARKGCSFPFTVASTMNSTDTTSDTMRPMALPCPFPDTSGDAPERRVPRGRRSSPHYCRPEGGVQARRPKGCPAAPENARGRLDPRGRRSLK